MTWIDGFITFFAVFGMLSWMVIVLAIVALASRNRQLSSKPRRQVRLGGFADLDEDPGLMAYESTAIRELERMWRAS